jgi:hypothetical protein
MRIQEAQKHVIRWIRIRIRIRVSAVFSLHFGLSSTNWCDPGTAYHFDADPNPAYHVDADPVPVSTFQIDADSDPDPQHC